VRYVALLRTINAGAESRLSMGQLREALEAAGLTVLATYLQSGNVVLEAPRTSGAKLRQRIEAAVQAQLGRPTAAVVLTTKQLERVLASAPSGWADEDGFTHHLIFVLPPATVRQVLRGLRFEPDVECVTANTWVIYWAIRDGARGRSSMRKLASTPSYSYLTVRTYQLIRRLHELAAAR
jgi:uncharacterized protein (DUF1697 family)